LNPAIQRYLSYCLLAYVFLVSFTRLWSLPVTYAKIQPTELVFIPLGILAFWHYGWRLWPGRTIGFPLLAYVAANVLSAFISGQQDALLEGLGRLYLGFMFLIFLTYLRETGAEGQTRMLKIWQNGALLLTILALGGYVLAVLGWPNETIRVYKNYPYFGTVLRAAGLNGGSGMVVIVLLWPTLWAWQEWRTRGKGGGYLLLFIVLLLLTLSKEVLLLALGLVLLEPRWQNLANSKKYILVGFTALFFWAATHWVLLPNTPVKDTYLAGMQYTSEKVWLKIGSLQVVETTYLALKRANWIIGSRNPWFGVGPGEFCNVVESLKSEGLYAKHLPNYNPHSTWGGAWSETGIFGLLTLLVLCILWGLLLVRRKELHSPAQKVVKVFLILMLINSVCMDVMNMRQLWLVWAIGLAGVLPLENKK
jgi:hypothetical protein